MGRSDSSVTIWNTADGSEAQTFRVSDRKVKRLAFSPDGKQILTGTEGEHPGIAREPGGLKLWDVATGWEIRTLLSRAEYAGVWELEFNQDGTRALSADNDGVVRVWERRNPRPVVTGCGIR